MELLPGLCEADQLLPTCLVLVALPCWPLHAEEWHLV
jgi:hypothetical protein